MSRIDPALVRQWREPETRQRHEVRDTLLYHLALGAGRLPGNAPLAYGWEERLVVLPSFAATLAPQRPWMLDAASTIDTGAMVHGEQGLTLHGPIPVEGEMIGETIEQHLWDNGPGRGAVLEMVRLLRAADAPERPVATLRSLIVLRGDGGFGGKARPSTPWPALPDRTPDLIAGHGLAQDQALFYRLCGDRHRLHVSPDFARAAGFDRPILHGLCTYGVACLLIAHHLCGDDPAEIVRFDARFSAPVFPGETLTLRLWLRPGRVAADFRCHAGDRLVLDRGYVEFAR